MTLADLWAAIAGVKTVIDVARGAVDAAKGIGDVRRAGEEIVVGSPEERVARGVVSALYFEILYNMQSIAEAQKYDPARLLVSRRVWDRSDRILDHLAVVVSPAEVGIVISPFVQLDNYERAFAMPWFESMLNRLTGTDHTLLEGLSKAFRDAEQLLRPKVLSKQQAERLDAFLKEHRLYEAPVPRPLHRRIIGVVGSIPVNVLVASAIAGELAIRDSMLWRRARDMIRYVQRPPTLL